MLAAEQLLLHPVQAREDSFLEGVHHHFNLDLPGAQGGQANPEQPSEPSSNTSTSYDLRNTVSRQLGQKIPFYKYLNSGAIPKQVKSVEEIPDSDRNQEIQTERVLGSEESPVTDSLSESPTEPPALLPPVVVTSPLHSDDDLSPSFGVIKLPEGPPSRSPVPLG